MSFNPKPQKTDQNQQTNCHMEITGSAESHIQMGSVIRDSPVYCFFCFVLDLTLIEYCSRVYWDSC